MTRGRPTEGKGLAAFTFLVAAALLVPATLVLTADSAEAATTRTLAITAATAKPTVPYAAFDGQAPKVFDIDGDGDLEIIAQNDNQWVYVFDSRTGGLLAEMRTTFPSGWGARSMNPPEVAILSGDGKVRLVLANSAAFVTSYVYDPGGSSTGKFTFHKEWERRLTDCHPNPGMDAKPVLADLDKDGRLEILAATEELGLYALRADGSIYWKNCIGGGNAAPAVGDLNLDSWPDVVFGSDAGVVTAMNGRTGATMWTFDARARFGLGSGSMPVGVAIGQLDGLTGPDVVVGARDSHDATDFGNNHALLLALSSGGSLLWGRQDPTGNPLTYTHPIIVDAAGDGQPEVYWADWNTMGHKPGNWEVTGPANFYRYDKAGNLVWKQSLGTFWNNKDIPLADVDGDGVQEMLANGPGPNGNDGIWYLDTRNGAKEAWVDLYPYKLNRAPIIADLYGNGRMQWVAQVAPYASGGSHGILVYDTGSPYSSVWPHLPYPPRGTGSPTSSSSSSSTGPSGPFDATFTGVSGNEWWVQANVASTGPTVSQVDVRLNGGAWQPLAKQSWGWANSYHIPQGTVVQLRATASDGQTDLSNCHQWIPPSGQSAATVACTGTSPGPFDATFTGVSGNEWWVQANVASTGPTVSQVDVRLNGGAWQPLAKQSWGWANSYHIPQGTVVQLRATASDGQTDLSNCHQWIPPSGQDAATVSCGGGTGTFSATFSPQAVGNDWWIEVAVDANQPLAKVEAKVGSGAWTDLTKQSWGTWAKSIHAPNGSVVTFRATSTGGATVTSGPTVWT